MGWRTRVRRSNNVIVEGAEMTPNGEREIVEVLHGLELRMTERMVRVETQLKAWRNMHDDMERRIDGCETLGMKLTNEINIVRDMSKERSNRLLIGLIIVALIAGTDVLARVAAGGVLS